MPIHLLKTALLVACTFQASLHCFSQTTLSETEKLAATARIWGFLKYYHPEVAEGKYDWDQQLFAVLPAVEGADSPEQLSKVFLDWIESLGTVHPCRKCRKLSNKDHFLKNFDLNWLHNERLFTNELTEKLRYIEANRHLGNQYYASYTSKKPENIQVTHEKTYEGADWQDKRFRLLSLFRYWNIVEYFFPYKYLTDTPWEEVLNRMIPEFLHATSESDYHLAMLALITGIDDSHGVFATDLTIGFLGKKMIPASVRILDDEAIITGIYNDSLARLDDLQRGDVITHVDGKTVASLFEEKAPYISGSNLAVKKANAAQTLLNGSADSVTIGFRRNDEWHSKTIRRYLYSDFHYKRPEQVSYRFLEDGIGYVNLRAATFEEVPVIMNAMAGTKAILFDLRNGANGTLYAFADYITSRRKAFYKLIVPDLDYPGKFSWLEGRAIGKNGGPAYPGKVILLVDEHTQSHAEFTAMCLQAGDHVTTIGSQTSGADGNVSRFEMVGGFKTMISGKGIFYPDGAETQRTGVRIDIVVRPTLEGIKAGKDEILEETLKWVKQQE